MDIDPNALKAGLNLFSAALAALKQAKDLLPDGSKKAEAAAALEQAEQQLKIAEAQAAKGLGYQLCQCDWPPQIMLFTGQKHHYKCPKCGYEKDLSPGKVHFPRRPRSRG